MHRLGIFLLPLVIITIMCCLVELEKPYPGNDFPPVANVDRCMSATLSCVISFSKF